MSKLNLNSKRFVVRKSLVGKNAEITVLFKSGNKVTYNHDKVYSLMKDKLENMECFKKYKSYTATNNIPVILRDKKLV
jgi:hypothetical protein